jgi:DNA (cytosine-5)-methyltransferase 1
MKYISLFAGIGGFDLALDRLGYECVWANDFDKYAGQVYNSRFNRQIDSRDIRLVKTDELPDFDLLVGGFPCQAFSIAGKRLGFEDTRGTLFFEIARIIKDKRPKYFLLENVKGLLNHNRGETFQTILATINELGYESEWQILNSKNHGVPQNRERIFISGYIRGEPRPKIFPIGQSNAENIIQINNPIHSNNRVYDSNGISSALNTMQGGNRQPKIISLSNRRTEYRISDISNTLTSNFRGYPDGDGRPAVVTCESNKVAIPTINPDRENKRQNGRRLKENGDISFTLTSQDKHGVYDGMRIRRLTEIECERLQGFPDNWTKDISSTQRYKCLGNAVTVNVIYDICKGYNEQH